MRWLRSVVLAVLVLCLAPGLTAAGSPSPVASPGAPVASPGAPVASPTADCSDLAASIRTPGGAGLEATATSGVEGIDPDDLLDPLLRSLGRDRTDVCGVTLRTADPPRAGMLLRIRGGGPDLAEALAGALVDQLQAYGQVVSTDRSEVGGVPVSRLLVGAAASATPLLVIRVTADSVLLTDSTELAETLVAALSETSPSVPSGPPASGGALGPRLRSRHRNRSGPWRRSRIALLHSADGRPGQTRVEGLTRPVAEATILHVR